MTKPRKPTPVQQEVIDKLRETGQPIVRWPGGFWTYRSCPPRDTREAGVPAWYVGTNTVYAMTAHGFLVRSNVHAESWRDERILPPRQLRSTL